MRRNETRRAGWGLPGFWCWMLGPTFLPCSFLARPKQSSGVEATPQRRDGLPREAKQGPREWQVRPSGQQRSECAGQGAWSTSLGWWTSGIQSL